MIYLVRHGQTDSNVSNTWQGQTGNDSLNAKGKLQASKLAEKLISKNIHKIIASPLKRASQTADIISEKLNIDVETDELLMEMNYGDIEGMNINEVTKKYGKLYSKWKDNPTNTQFPEGESFEDLLERAKKIKEKYFDTKDNILLISHEDITRAMIVVISGRSKEFWLPDIPNASVVSYPAV